MEIPLDEQENLPRRSPRRSYLQNVTNLSTTIIQIPEETPPRTSPDEFIIQQRGPRRKPITWSPVDYNKTDILGPSRDKTPDRTARRTEISSKLRRRLIMSPDEDLPITNHLGQKIAKKLKTITDASTATNEDVIQQ